MNLYNFFTENVKADRLKDLEEAKKQIDEEFGEYQCQILKTCFGDHVTYVLIGQVWGGDTNMGDIDLLVILGDFNFTWFDSHNIKDNNIDR
jgi:hypothetical protein